MQRFLSEHKHLDLLIIIKQAKSNHTQNNAQQRPSVKKIPYIHHSLPPAQRCMNKLLKGLLCVCICHRPAQREADLNAQRDASARTYMPKYKECYLLDSLHWSPHTKQFKQLHALIISKYPLLAPKWLISPTSFHNLCSSHSTQLPP